MHEVNEIIAAGPDEGATMLSENLSETTDKVIEQQALGELLAGEKPKPPTRSEIKKYFKQFWTVQYPRVEACGHKYVENRQPRHRNCEHCWVVWFNQHGELVQTADEVFQKEGRQMLNQLQGKKFTKMFLKFMSTVAHLKDIQDGVQPNIS